MHLAKYSQLHRLPIPSHEMIGVICLTFTTKKAQVRVILGVAEWKIIVGQLLFCGEGIIQCLFNFFLFITSEKHEIIATAKASSSESESWGATPAYAHHAILPSPNFFPWVLSYPSPQSERERKRERETDRRLGERTWERGWPSPCTTPAQAFSVNAFRWDIRDERPELSWTSQHEKHRPREIMKPRT